MTLINTTNNEVDILVFPEFTLNLISTAVTVPKPEDNVVPCNDDRWSRAIQNISCAAREAKKYVVIDVAMKRNCTEERAETNDTRPCTKGDWNIYNTAVVFDRQGQVIAT